MAKYNLVHTYVEGNSFNNIFGGNTLSAYGSITKLEHMTPMMTQRWPWMKGLWSLTTDKGTGTEYYDTLREAKEAALTRWPTCTFKTRKQISKECDTAGIRLGDM